MKHLHAFCLFVACTRGEIRHDSWDLLINKLKHATRLRLDIRSRAAAVQSIVASPLLYVASLLPMPPKVLKVAEDCNLEFVVDS